MANDREERLADFADWLRRGRFAPENRIPYLIRWTQRFLRLSALRPREAWHDTLRVFLEDLGQGETPDWQIRQAADAVNLYCGQFRGARGTAYNEQGSRTPSAAHTLSWDQPAVLREMQDLLRLRHSACPPDLVESLAASEGKPAEVRIGLKEVPVAG